MRFWLVGGTLMMALGIGACGGAGSPSASPTAPSSGGAVGATVTIVGNNGSQSFTPNPGDASQGATIVWKNNDNTTHHIVLNDGSLDTGDIGPGASSSAMRIGTDGANYHCTIHPSMVGSIKASSGAPPPCQGVYCG